MSKGMTQEQKDARNAAERARRAARREASGPGRTIAEGVRPPAAVRGHWRKKERKMWGDHEEDPAYSYFTVGKTMPRGLSAAAHGIGRYRAAEGYEIVSDKEEISGHSDLVLMRIKWTDLEAITAAEQERSNRGLLPVGEQLDHRTLVQSGMAIREESMSFAEVGDSLPSEADIATYAEATDRLLDRRGLTDAVDAAVSGGDDLEAALAT